LLSFSRFKQFDKNDQKIEEPRDLVDQCANTYVKYEKNQSCSINSKNFKVNLPTNCSLWMSNGWIWLFRKTNNLFTWENCNSCY